ncbi:MAG: hypothetical protein R3C59_24295 [Planctomycetaceae bacterium]
MPGPNSTRPLSGAAWNDIDQLLPVDADEAILEMELDEIPPGLIVTKGAIAATIMVLMAVVAELTLLRASGFAGPAVFFPGAAVLIAMGIPRRSLGLRTCVLAALLVGVSYRLAVNGTWMQVAVAAWLLSALTLSMRHQPPFFLRTIVFGIESFWAGTEFFLSLHTRVARALTLPDEERPANVLFNLGLPAVVVISLGGLALAMRPELLQSFQLVVSDQPGAAASVLQMLNEISPIHVGVWFLVIWVTAGLLRPVLAVAEMPPVVIDDADGDEPYHAPFYIPLRNTLVGVTLALAVLVWSEFHRLSTASGIPDADYAAYTQHGLAALGLVSLLVMVLLTVIFNGATLADTRIRTIRALSCVLIGLNLLFAACVVARFADSIEFNGLSRLKVLELLAVASVSGALLLTVYMTYRQHHVVWLLRRSGWLAALAGYAFLVMPIDRIVQQYNVKAILKGNPAPIVQITRDEIDDEAVAVLLPLCDIEDTVIREGAMAIVAGRLESFRKSWHGQAEFDWTATQWGQKKSHEVLLQFAESRDLALSPPTHEQAQHRLHEYSQQWW